MNKAAIPSKKGCCCWIDGKLGRAHIINNFTNNRFKSQKLFNVQLFLCFRIKQGARNESHCTFGTWGCVAILDARVDPFISKNLNRF